MECLQEDTQSSWSSRRLGIERSCMRESFTYDRVLRQNMTTDVLRTSQLHEQDSSRYHLSHSANMLSHSDNTKAKNVEICALQTHSPGGSINTRFS